MIPPSFEGRLGLVQRVLPAYRAPFFEALAQRCAGGLGLFAGQARAEERHDGRRSHGRGRARGVARVVARNDLHHQRRIGHVLDDRANLVER